MAQLAHLVQALAHPARSCALAPEQRVPWAARDPERSKARLSLQFLSWASARSRSGRSTPCWYAIALDNNWERRTDRLAIIHRKGSVGRRAAPASRNSQTKRSVPRRGKPGSLRHACRSTGTSPPALGSGTGSPGLTGKSHLSQTHLETGPYKIQPMCLSEKLERGKGFYKSFPANPRALTNSKKHKCFLYVWLFNSYSSASFSTLLFRCLCRFYIKPQKTDRKINFFFVYIWVTNSK